MLVRLLKIYPSLPQAPEIRKILTENLSQKNILEETNYFQQPGRRSFERTYGWAWLLKLAAELHDFEDPDASEWYKNLSPLTNAIVNSYIDFFPRQQYPIRRGVHPNTAFGLAFALDFARTTGNVQLEALIVERSRTYFEGDHDYPARFEPDGDDFLSRSLIEADLMRRVLNEKEFFAWLHRFLPNLAQGEPVNLLNPVSVSDRNDPKIVHLDGLNLSRAWCLRGIAKTLPATNPLRSHLLASAVKHAEATLPHIASGNYEGEHWLAAFAVYMLTTP